MDRAHPSKPGTRTLTGKQNSSAGTRAAYAAIFLVGAFLCLWQLDDRRLWGDEAETAVLAVNITRFGLPITVDGRNEITNLPDRQDANDQQLWVWSPWLDEYVAAASIYALGPTTFAARLPFALLGLATLAMVGVVARRIYGGHAVALIAMTLTVTCVPFLLHVRQARYYGLLAFAATWILYGLARSLAGRPGAGAIHMALGLAVLFYSNYITALGFSIGLGILAVGAFRSQPALARSILGAGVVFGVLALPWILFASAGSQLAFVDGSRFFPNLAYYASEIHFHLVPWVLLAAPLLALAVASLRGRARTAAPNTMTRSFEIACWLLLASSLLVDALSPLRFFRYLTPLVPLVMILGAAFLVRFVHPPTLRWAAVAILGLSNLVAVASGVFFSSPPRHPLSAPLWDFVASITSPFPERLDPVLAYLDAETNPDDTLWVPDPEFPLIFYTNLRILDARLSPGVPEPRPEWIFPVSASGLSTRRQLRLPPSLDDQYKEIRLRVPRSARGGSRPDPHAHALEATAEMEDFRIYRKRQNEGTAQSP